MPTLTTSPTFAPPKGEVQVRFALSEPSANFVRVWVTEAPPGSELKTKLDKATQNRFAVYTGDGGDANPWKQTFDLGGKYTLVAQEYVRGAQPYGGGYQGSPDGNPSETKVGSESTLELFIGQRLTSVIQAGEHQVTLALWVWDSKIQQTTLN